MANNPLDYLIQNPDAMRYALLQDASYKDGGQASKDEDLFALKPQPKPAVPTVQELLAEIGKNPARYEAKYPAKDFTPLDMQAYQLMQAAKKTPDANRYLESLNPYFDSQLRFDIGAGSDAGYVKFKEPNVAVMQQLKDVKNTIPHELTHTLQLGKGKDVNPNLENNHQTFLRQNDLSQEMRDKVFPSSNVTNMKEVWANVAARAHEVNAAGGDFINSPEGKALFPTNTEQRDYYTNAMPGVNSMTPSTGTFVPNKAEGGAIHMEHGGITPRAFSYSPTDRDERNRQQGLPAEFYRAGQTDPTMQSYGAGVSVPVGGARLTADALGSRNAQMRDTLAGIMLGAEFPVGEGTLRAETMRPTMQGASPQYGVRYSRSFAEGGIIDGHPVFQTAQIPFAEYRHSIGMNEGGRHFDEGGQASLDQMRHELINPYGTNYERFVPSTNSLSVNEKPASLAYTQHDVPIVTESGGIAPVPRTVHDDRLAEIEKQLDKGVKPDWMSGKDFLQDQAERKGYNTTDTSISALGQNVLAALGNSHILGGAFRALGAPYEAAEKVLGSSMGLDPMTGIIGKTGELHSIPKAGQYAASRAAPVLSKIDQAVRSGYESGLIPQPGFSIKDVTPKTLSKAEREANLARYTEESSVKEPLYHGAVFIDESGQPFRVPNTSTGTEKLGFHVGTPEQASYRVLLTPDPDVYQPNAHLMPLYVNSKNPLRVTDDEANDASQLVKKLLVENKITLAQYKDFKAKSAHDDEPEKHAVKLIKSLGHDSLVYSNGVEGAGDSYVLFNPHQVKSATSNVGTYDIKNPDMGHARGGSVKKPFTSPQYSGYNNTDYMRYELSRQG